MKRLHATYRNMLQRCYNPACKAYPNYGGRGIDVCGAWRNSREAFVAWAFNNGYNEKLTLDRIDNSAGYSPDNCRWADYFVQLGNTRRSRFITFNGETLILQEWARRLGCSAGALRARLEKHPPEVALSKPLFRFDPKAHGTRGVYNKGCRCEQCSEANRAHHRASRAKLKARRLANAEAAN